LRRRTREGPFRVVYRFDNEQLLELINRTAHAAALSALVESAHAYRFYFAVYVRNVSAFTPIYMALIDPFRKLVVYQSLDSRAATRRAPRYGVGRGRAAEPPGRRRHRRTRAQGQTDHSVSPVAAQGWRTRR